MVVNLALAILTITTAARTRLWILGFFTYILDCGSTGLVFLGNLLALIHGLILLSLSPKPRLQLGCLENVLISYPLLVMDLLPYGAAVVCLNGQSLRAYPPTMGMIGCGRIRPGAIKPSYNRTRMEMLLHTDSPASATLQGSYS